MKKKYLLVIAALFIAFGFGYAISRGDKEEPPKQENTTDTASKPDAGDATSLVSYTLPDGWTETTCEGSNTIYVLPNGVSDADCSANTVSAIKLLVDPGNHTDCNQLQNVSEVKKHVCISLYINDNKSLKASTEYLASSTYKQDTTINAFYVDTGKGVVKLEYSFTTDSQFQAGFEQLANSIRTKPAL